jgi:hypothetical protein
MADAFNDRRNQLEAKFAHDEETKFMIDARRDKLFAEWAAGRMSQVSAADYSHALLEFALGKTDADIVAKVTADLANAKARREIMEG